MPQATGKLWDHLGAATSLGALGDQNIPDAGTFGLLPEGSAITELAALFPVLSKTAKAMASAEKEFPTHIRTRGKL